MIGGIAARTCSVCFGNVSLMQLAWSRSLRYSHARCTVFASQKKLFKLPSKPLATNWQLSKGAWCVPDYAKNIPSAAWFWGCCLRLAVSQASGVSCVASYKPVMCLPRVSSSCPWDTSMVWALRTVMVSIACWRHTYLLKALRRRWLILGPSATSSVTRTWSYEMNVSQ